MNVILHEMVLRRERIFEVTGIGSKLSYHIALCYIYIRSICSHIQK